MACAKVRRQENSTAYAISKMSDRNVRKDTVSSFKPECLEPARSDPLQKALESALGVPNSSFTVPRNNQHVFRTWVFSVFAPS